jgi:hypothetical protein
MNQDCIELYLQCSFQGPQKQEAGGLLSMDFEYLVFYNSIISTVPLHFSGLWNKFEIAL